MKKRKNGNYKKSLIIFALVLLIIGEVFLIYVSSTLKEFELADPDNFIASIIEDMKRSTNKGNVGKYFTFEDINSPYENSPSFENGYKELLNNANMTYKKAGEDNTYSIFADDNLIAKVYLKTNTTRHRLGLLTYDVLEIDKIECFNQNGLYALDIYVDSMYDLYINGNKALEDDLKASDTLSQYNEVKSIANVPKHNHYYINNLTNKPELKVKDKDGNSFDLEYKDGAYYFEKFEEISSYEDAKGKLKYDYNPLELAEKWSLFLTADLTGARYGFYTIASNMIEDTDMYNKTWSWATNVDITFTSLHTLDKETFTNEKVSNFIFYNDDAFSCEVYLEKHLTLIDRQKRTDVLHDRFYYVYYEDGYKLIKMESIME